MSSGSSSSDNDSGRRHTEEEGPSAESTGGRPGEKVRLEPGVPLTNVYFKKLIRAQAPRLIEVGRPKPRVVFSFGGAGWMFAYSLGVAQYLAEEQKSLLNESYFLGAGTGSIPAAALGAGLTDMVPLRDAIFRPENLFNVADKDSAERRKELVEEIMKEFAPPGAEKLLNGKTCFAVNMSPSESAFRMQNVQEKNYGHHIPIFDSNDDIAEIINAAMGCNKNKPEDLRGAYSIAHRATTNCPTSQIDQAVRHVYIKGICGVPGTKKSMMHTHWFGSHGTLLNTHMPWWKQYWLGCAPLRFQSAEKANDLLLDAFEDGYFDGKRYERWMEDSYHFAQADRSDFPKRSYLEILWSPVQEPRSGSERRAQADPYAKNKKAKNRYSTRGKAREAEKKAKEEEES